VTLRRLEGKGLLRSEVGSSSSKGGRPRRYYAPTPDGIEALRAFHTVWTRVLTGLPLPDLETGG
jgi:DNA-binding PadR family transcriptional regulator